MNRIKLTILLGILFLSCSTVRSIKNSGEITNVLKAFNEKHSIPSGLYFKSVNISPNNPDISRKKFIEKPGSLIIDNYSENYMQRWLKKIDSLTNLVASHKRDSAVTIINEKFKINTEKLFTEDDRYYMLSQIEQKNIKWKKIALTPLHLTKSKKAIKASIPIFTKDHQLAIIFVTMPGFEGLEVYKKLPAGWEFYFGSTLLIE
ncbi:hypothetical protein [Salinimicrobium sp. WS361]|uniref:hypothetical protein n=1 Tax=Salinimicrobium sp. WS361 TaxID=3425123 RepID=UPI003D6FB44C